MIASEEVGALLLVAGFAAKGRTAGVVVNAGWAVGLAAALALEGRKRARAGS